MEGLNRREFMKRAGLGAGALMASGLISGAAFTGCGPGGGDAMSESYFGFTKEDIRKLLETALSKGGDFSELFFEHKQANSVTMQEDIIKSSSESVSLGVGIRVLKGEATGYAFTNDLTFEKIKQAALTAAAIASAKSKNNIAAMTYIKPAVQAYSLHDNLAGTELKSKIDLIKRAYTSAQKYDPRIVKVSATLADEVQRVTIANSKGLLVSDVRPQARLVVIATAESNGVKNTGFGNDGGRIGYDFYSNVRTPEDIGKEASEEAIILLDAKNPPPGEQMVVLSKDKSGVMIHEAVGHPLEADANWKKTSIMWDKMGQQVANDIVTIYDDATIPDYRGSLNIDDEGTNTEPVPLIEKGKLVGYMNDLLAAKILGQKPNGHGRRESYQHPPIPRMNNTILAKGEHDPEEIIRSVKKGFYAKTYQGGMVNNTGKFTFSVNLGYLIEDGKLTAPLKNATLIGSNIQILKEVDMVGNDMGFFLGTCGKDGQSVPVTCGTPSLRIRKMTVGGSV